MDINFYSRPYKIETMRVCLVMGGKNHKTHRPIYASMRVKGLNELVPSANTTKFLPELNLMPRILTEILNTP